VQRGGDVLRRQLFVHPSVHRLTFTLDSTRVNFHIDARQHPVNCSVDGNDVVKVSISNRNKIIFVLAINRTRPSCLK
jgi:hypothetical protein